MGLGVHRLDWHKQHVHIHVFWRPIICTHTDNLVVIGTYPVLNKNLIHLLIILAIFLCICAFTIIVGYVKYMCVCVGGSDNGGRGEEGRGEDGSEPPPMSPVLAEYIADARKKVEELRNKTGQWTRRLTEIHQLTMHTAVSRKDNDTPAAVTSIHISR